VRARTPGFTHSAFSVASGVVSISVLGFVPVLTLAGVRYNYSNDAECGDERKAAASPAGAGRYKVLSDLGGAYVALSIWLSA